MNFSTLHMKKKLIFLSFFRMLVVTQSSLNNGGNTNTFYFYFYLYFYFYISLLFSTYIAPLGVILTAQHCIYTVNSRLVEIICSFQR